MTDLQKEFEATGHTSWINSDFYPDGKIYTQEYTEWLERQVVALRQKYLPEYNEILYHAKTLADEQFREYWNEIQDKPIIVTGIMKDSYGTLIYGITRDNLYCNARIEHCEPVPLSNDLLLSAGFKPTTDYFLRKNIGMNNTLEVSILKKRTIIFDNKRKLYVELKFCKYAHQLQSLYLCLTGKELMFERSQSSQPIN